jgi:hypothetical protein
MLPVEVVMSRSFTQYTDFNILRRRVLSAIVDTTDYTVRTREVLLRVLHSNLSGIFVDYKNIQPDIEATICEKRSSLDIAANLDYLQREFVARLPVLNQAGVSTQYLAIIYSALRSKNAILRVAGYCSIILLVSILELRA